MKQFLLHSPLSLLLLPALFVGVLMATPVSTASAAACDSEISVSSGVECAKGKNVKGSLVKGPDSLFKTVTNVLLFLIGAVSVIMIIIGGIRYVLSNGDSSQVTSAKNTILYSVIGLIVALLAYAIVGFVVDSFIAGNGGNNATN